MDTIRTNLLNILWDYQNKFGYISKDAIINISKQLNVSKIEIEGVISFYHFFHLKPTGKYIIYLNNSINSYFKGFTDVKAAFEKETGCNFNEYSNNSLFSLFETSCIGLSDQEPAALINFYPFTNLNPTKVKSIISNLKNGVNPKNIASNPLSKIQYKPDDSKTVFFRKYIAGNALNKLKLLNANEVLDQIEAGKLMGLGGAFFPTALKWRFCKEQDNNTKFIICNADEGEPGTFKDKALLAQLPGLILEGMIIAAYTVGAKKGFIYLRAEYKYLQENIQNTINSFVETGYLGKNIAGIKGFDFDITIQLGAGAYVCGEETALIESLEGKRGEPRIKKYFPTQVGYLGYPTVVNNVETFAKAARILELGADFISEIGTNESKGTKLLSISGDIAKPGIYEIEYGTSIRELLGLEMCQATSPYFIQISGPSGICLNTNDFDRKICKEDLLCGGAVMVFNRTRNILDILENYLYFFKTESCGNCTPCRAGNQILYEKIKKFKKGLCSKTDLEEIKNWGQIIKLTSRCGLGQFSANTLTIALDKFSDYFNLITMDADQNQNVEFDMETATKEYNDLIQETQKH
jgi:[NiFe] hydrogenase diaphorase moiety large subunit